MWKKIPIMPGRYAAVHCGSHAVWLDIVTGEKDQPYRLPLKAAVEIANAILEAAEESRHENLSPDFPVGACLAARLIHGM